MSTATFSPAAERTWTAIGSAMRVTNSKAKRKALLGAAATMAWVNTSGALPVFENPAVDLVVRALFNTARDTELSRVAKADLPGHQALIGLQDNAGTRCYVVEDHSEAIYVLLEQPARSAA